MTSPTRLPQTILCVPGPWKTRNDLVMAVAKQSGGYLYAGVAMMHRETRESTTVQFEERNQHLAPAFASAGRGWIDEESLAQIDAHQSCVYLVADGGSEEAAKTALLAAAALLKCGGLAVKIESTGIAHSAARWGTLSADPHLLNLYRAYVIFVGGGGEYYSCGMHNLGRPDCVVAAEIDSRIAAQTMDAFLKYLLIEAPELHSGETFRVGAEAPPYQLRREPCAMFPPEDLFHNPYGVWKLTPAE